MPERDLLVLSEEPLNAETRLDRQRGPIVPAGRHYVRTHFAIPEAPHEIRIWAATDAAGAPTAAGSGPARSVTLDEIRRLPARTLAVTLECAGNGRKFLDPPVPGEQWGLGAVGTAEWTGSPLHTLLERAWLSSAVEVLFRGADEGLPKGLEKPIAFERSLPIEVATRDDTLVAYAMNGEPIPPEHGGPLRLIVPSWYGVASVKWLAEIRVLDRPFEGFFQRDRYVIEGRPLRNMEPRAVISAPADGSEISEGGHVDVRGFAWSGHAPVERVELCGTGGTPLASTTLPAGTTAQAWQEFAFRVSLVPGEHVLTARATDRKGNTQPETANWNALGYSNNAVRPTRVRVRG